MTPPVKTLYIIGNGFDLHHGLHTSYADFKEWLEYCHPMLYEEFITIYGKQVLKGEWWANFESNLGELDMVSFYNKYHTEVPDDVWEEAKKHNTTNLPPNPIWQPAGERLRSLYFFLDVVMRQWLGEMTRTLPYGKRIAIQQDNSFFITFNYTNVLERLYRIPPKKILHIHGSLADNNDLIFGHSQSYSLFEHQCDMKGQWFPSDRDAHEIGMVFGSKEKLPYEHITKHGAIFQSLSRVQQIYVYGLSFSEIDMPYLTYIQSIVPNANWFVSYFGNEGKEKIIQALKTHICWKKTDIYWVTLDELMLEKKL